MNFRPLLFIPPVALGVLGFVWMTSQPAPVVEPLPEAALAVRVLEIAPRSIAGTATGFGRVVADHSWPAISEVQGRIVDMAPGINVGSIVEKGQLLVAVDRTDYELSRQKSLANIESVEAQLSELTRQEMNSEALLEVETRILTVAQAELDRVQALLERGTGTQAAVDVAQKTRLSSDTSITNLNNILALYPAQRASLRATLAVRQAELREVERLLEKSVITAPFRGRVATLSAEVGQFVRSGDTLITLESTKAAEITAEIQPRAFSSLVLGFAPSDSSVAGAFETSQFTQMMSEVGVQAEVSMATSDMSGTWPAEIVRLRGTMDSDTGAMGIVVRVDDPLRAAPEFRRPPLHTGSFVRVTLTATPIDGVIAIPRHAVHLSDTGQPYVFLSNAEDRLELRDVTLGRILDDDVVVADGLAGKDMLVLGDPRPPVPGVKLTPVVTAPVQRSN